MTTNSFFAVSPSGLVFKRTSTRQYTHCLVASRPGQDNYASSWHSSYTLACKEKSRRYGPTGLRLFIVKAWDLTLGPVQTLTVVKGSGEEDTQARRLGSTPFYVHKPIEKTSVGRRMDNGKPARWVLTHGPSKLQAMRAGAQARCLLAAAAMLNAGYGAQPAMVGAIDWDSENPLTGTSKDARDLCHEARNLYAN